MSKQQIVYKFNPEMLIIGREIRGLSQEDLAGQVNISAQLQAAIEAGKSHPGHWLVSRYSDVLSYPTAFFYCEEGRSERTHHPN